MFLYSLLKRLRPQASGSNGKGFARLTLASGNMLTGYTDLVQQYAIKRQWLIGGLIRVLELYHDGLSMNKAVM